MIIPVFQPTSPTNMKTLLTSFFAASIAIPSVVCGQLFWNPNIDGYSTVGGNGTWSRTGPGWWNGTTNVNMADGQNVIFEGQGNVTGQTDGNSPRSGNITFQNLTGEYVFTNYFLRWAGTRTITNNDTNHAVTLGSVFRNNGDVTLNFAGPGDINMPGIFGSSGVTIAVNQNGTGRLNLTGATVTSVRAFNLNNGELFIGGNSLSFGNANTNFTWNGGSLVYEFDNLTESFNRFGTGGDLVKGSASDYIFDFSGFHASAPGTYTLMTFTNTTFLSTDFTATNITYESGLLGQFNLNAGTLEFTVIPEPSTYAAIFGMAAFGLLVWRRRRLK